jgi:toxin-antitoxin system PIN domain toxin
MSETVDANLLLFASDVESPRHQQALERVRRFAAGPELLYVFWPVAMAYLRIATHPSIFARPLEPARARAGLSSLLRRPHVRCPGEQDGFWSVFEETVAGDVVRGNLVPDAHLVALMRQHGVRTIWTADRDFRRFTGITVRDPFG